MKKDIKFYIEQRLTQKERIVLYNRLGILGQRKTLEEIGIILNNLTRERIRQIEKRIYQKIKGAIKKGDIRDTTVETIINFATKITFLDQIEIRECDYPPTTHCELVANIFSETLEIIKHPAFSKRRLLSLTQYNLKNKLTELTSFLSETSEFQSLQKVSSRFEIPSDVILSMTNVVNKDGEIAVESNRSIFYPKGVTSRVLEILKDYGKPMKIKEIAHEGNLSTNQARSAIERIPEAINVGLSTYALKEWGYIEGWASDIAHHYLEEAGEPMTTRNITKLVLKQKRIKARSVYMAMKNDNRLAQLNTGHWVLRRWGYENIRVNKGKSFNYKISATEALNEVLKDNKEFLSIKQILKLVQQRYGDDAPKSYSSYYPILQVLEKEGKITKIKNGKFCYYKK
jgi:hypothetical protein